MARVPNSQRDLAAAIAFAAEEPRTPRVTVTSEVPTVPPPTR